MNLTDHIALYEDATAGTGSTADATFKMSVSFDYRLAKRIAKRNVLYYKGHANNANRTLIASNPETHCVIPISCPGAFIRMHVKKRDRHLVTDEVEEKVMALLFDRENGFAAPLPPREVQYCAFLNGYFNIYRGKFCKDRNFPGYQRFAVQTDFIKKKHCTHREEIAATIDSVAYQELLRCLSLLLSGYPVERCLLWCSDPVTADLLQQVLMSLLPQTGAVIELNINGPTPDFQQAAKGDNHAVLVHIREAKALTTKAWTKLHALAEAHKPALIIAGFLPFMADDADPDDLLKGSLHLVPAGITTADFTDKLLEKPDWIAVVASDSIRFLHEFINRVEPETAPDVDELLARPDPNDIRRMTDEFLHTATIETEFENDIIEQSSDFCARLAEFVKECGGDPKTVKPKGIGVHLKNLGVNRSEVKLPGRQDKVMCLTKRKWK